jgi:hypothetical protein
MPAAKLKVFPLVDVQDDEAGALFVEGGYKGIP